MDETGKPTSWELMEIPSDGGGGGSASIYRAFNGYKEVKEEMEEEVQVRMVLLQTVVIVHLLEVLKTLVVL